MSVETDPSPERSAWLQMDANFALHPSEALLLAQILEQLAREKHSLLTFLCGDRLEDLFADYPSEQCGLPRLSRGAGRCERIGYLISVYIQTEKFFEEHPECNTRKENWGFWGNVSNPGCRRHGKMKEFAERHRCSKILSLHEFSYEVIGTYNSLLISGT